MGAPENYTLTAIPGIRVGHVTDTDAVTGCTVILCPSGTVGAVDVRGGAPGTRETDLLDPVKSLTEVNAIMLSGGSAFGLATADGAMRFLRERGEGYRTQSGQVVPIVPTAILFDLAIGRDDVTPDAAMGYAACIAASDAPVIDGSVGAGTGCRVGALLGNALASKGGVGSAAEYLDSGLIVAALVAVNSVGDVLDESGAILAGVRAPEGGFADMMTLLRAMAMKTNVETEPRENTVIGVIATNAQLTKAQAAKVAQMAHDGIARAVRPAHTPYDGDALFVLATGSIPSDPLTVGAIAAEIVAAAIRRGVRTATTLGGVAGL